VAALDGSWVSVREGARRVRPSQRNEGREHLGPLPTVNVFQFFGRDGGTQVQATVIGRPTGLTHLSQPIISLSKHENLDPGYARLERALDTATSSEAG